MVIKFRDVARGNAPSNNKSDNLELLAYEFRNRIFHTFTVSKMLNKLNVLPPNLRQFCVSFASVVVNEVDLINKKPLLKK